MNVNPKPGVPQPPVNTDSGNVRDKPAEASAFLERAELYYARGNWTEAIAFCQKAVNDEPNLAPAYVTWGNALQARGKIEELMEPRKGKQASCPFYVFLSSRAK